MQKALQATEEKRKKRNRIEARRQLEKWKELKQKRRNEEEVLLANKTAQQPTKTGAAKAHRIMQHIRRNEEEKKRSERRRKRDRAAIQQARYLGSKYGNLCTAYKVMDYLDCPTKTKLKKLRAREAAKTIVADARRTLHSNSNQPSNLVKAIAKSWRKQDKPSSILDTGYSGANIITP